MPGAEIREGDARELPFASGSFDVVTLFTVLSSLGSTTAVRQALAEARRVLAPNGVLLVWEPRIGNPFNRDVRLIGWPLLAANLPPRQEVRLTTVVPAVARRLGRLTGTAYPRLAAVDRLLTHRLVCAREAAPCQA